MTGVFQWDAIKDSLVAHGYIMTKSQGGLECWYKPGFKPSAADLDMADVEADFIDEYREEVGYD